MTRPIFIVGSGRSGTSVLTWALGQHANIITMPEMNWLTGLACYMDSLYRLGMATAPMGHFSRFNVEKQAFLEDFGAGIDQLVRHTFERRFPQRRKTLEVNDKLPPSYRWYRSPDDPKERWVDGTPSNTPYAMTISRMFPESKFVNLVRDPEQVVKSWLGISWRAKEHAKPAAVVEHIYHSQRAGYLVDAALAPQGRSMRMLHSQLVAQPEESLRQICDFVCESFDPNCLVPLTTAKINSSGETSPQVMKEYASVTSTKLLGSMQDWYRWAADPAWQIDSAEKAEEALAAYEKYRIPLN